MPEMGSPDSDMAMMGMVSQQLNFAASTNNLCCVLAPAETTPGPVRASMTNGAYSVLMPVASPLQISQTKKTNAPYREIRPESCPPRALFCVFLI
jgi:hypothetical protein